MTDQQPHELVPPDGKDELAFLRAAIDAMPGAVCVTHLYDATFVLVNRAFEELIGWPAADLLGQNSLEISVYAGPLTPDQIGQAILADGSLHRYESRIRTRSGELKRMNNSTAVFEAGTEHYLVTMSSADAEEQAAMHEAIHESESRMQAIVDAAPFHFALIDLQGRFRMVNRSGAELLGRPADELLGLRFLDVVPHDGAEQLQAEMQAALAEGVRHEWAGALTTAQQGERWYEATLFPLHERNGNPYAVCVVALDVTDQRQAEGAREESETRFRQLAESIDDAFVLWATDPLEMLYASPALGSIYGVDLQDILDDNRILDRATHPDDRRISWQMFAERTRSNEDFDYEIRVIHPDGAVRWIRVRSSRVRVDGAPVNRVATTMSDVTERKQADLEVQAARATAEEANQRKNDFLSRMSHELRTPLNAILGFSQLLELDDLTAEQRSNVAHVGRAGRHLLDLINDVLDVSRIESGELRLSIEPVDLTAAALEAVQMMRPQLEDSEVQLIVPDQTPSVQVRADRQRLIQVLLNLLSNAIKFNRAGGRAELRWAVLPTGRVRVEVLDTGIGIADADLSRLFTPFERFEQTIEGTGIGLVLTRQLVEAMHGSITVTSRLGEGTAVTVELAGTPATPGALVAGETGTGRQGSQVAVRGTVLCVEDNPSNVELVRKTLALLPHCTVVFATSGSQAMVLARSVAPDLVLLDLHLPDIPGEEVLRRLRSEPTTAGVPVVVVSADAVPDHVTALRTAGAHRYLTKPYKLSQLLEVVEEALGEGL